MAGCKYSNCITQIFYATNGYFTGNLTALDVPQFVFDGKCSGVPVINAGPTSYSFEIAVHPRHPDDLVGHIRTDRLIWFTKK